MSLLIGDILADAAAARPHGLGATLGDETRTFAELDAGAARAAGALSALGVGRGDVVVWWSGASLTAVDGFFGCAQLGAPVCTVNPALPVAEMGPVLDYLQPRLVVCDADRASDAGPLCAQRAIPLARDDLPGDTRPAPMPDPPLDEDETHVIYLTSGTTGRPKGVAVSHRASWLRSSPAGAAFGQPWRGDGGMLTCFPLFHYAGWHYVMEAWQYRVPVHLIHRASAEEMVAVAERWRPVAMYCIPAVWERVLDPVHAAADLSSIRRADTGTSPASGELIDRIRARFPQAEVCVLYGSTEGGHTTTLAHWDVDARPGSVGRAAFPSTVKVDEDGEVVVRSDTLMSGYLRLPEETAEVLDDGWYRTGDLGRLDEDGYLYLTGRRRDVIRTGGETVAPPQVEGALAGHPAVAEVAVVGLPDEAYGEVVTAVVVAAVGHEAPSVASLREYLSGRLPSYAHPRRVVKVASLPHTAATGQVQRSLVRQLLVGGGLVVDGRAGTPAAPPADATSGPDDPPPPPITADAGAGPSRAHPE